MIRRYTQADTDALVAIWEAANALAHPFLSADFVAQVKDDMRAIYLPNAETWVMEKDGAPVGFISMIDTEIGGLFLDPAHHGQGLGKALIDHVAALKGPLRVDVFAQNAVGRPFYERYGFETRAAYLHGASGHMLIRMAMPGHA